MSRPLKLMSHETLFIRVRQLGLAIRTVNGEYQINYVQGKIPLHLRARYRKSWACKSTEKGSNTLRLKIWEHAQKMAKQHPEWLKPRGELAAVKVAA